MIPEEWKYRLIGLGLIALGILILYRTGRARFKRINRYGVEQFRNYNHKLNRRLEETVSRAIALMMLVAGAVLLLVSMPEK